MSNTKKFVFEYAVAARLATRLERFGFSREAVFAAVAALPGGFVISNAALVATVERLTNGRFRATVEARGAR